MSTQIKNENSKTWEGKVALPTVSEYIRTNSNKSRCGTLLLINDNYSSCVSTGWMDNNDYWWTLSSNSGNSYHVFIVDLDGSFGSRTACPPESMERKERFITFRFCLTLVMQRYFRHALTPSHSEKTLSHFQKKVPRHRHREQKSAFPSGFFGLPPRVFGGGWNLLLLSYLRCPYPLLSHPLPSRVLCVLCRDKACLVSTCRRTLT